MRRTPIGVLLVALLTATAGCGGFLGGDGGPTREPYGVDPTPTRTATGTATPTGTPEPGTPLASAAFQEAVANHTAALRRAGNFTIRWTRQGGRVIDGAEPEPFTQVAKVDLDADRYVFGDPPANGSGSVEVEAYQSGEKWYQRTGDEFRNRTGITDPDGFTPRNYARQRMRYPPNRSVLFPFERNGTATFDGEEMRRFTADDPGYFDGSYTDFGNVTEFEATALVDDRGIVRRYTYSIRGRTPGNATYVESERWTVTDVGSTTVRPLAAILGEVEPDGASAAFREAVANDVDPLRVVGNFTVREVQVSGPADANTARREVRTVAEVDPAAVRYLLRRWQSGGEGRTAGVTYRNRTGLYARGPTTDGFENATGSSLPKPRAVAYAMVRHVLGESVEFRFRPNGTATFDGERMARFTADDPGDFRGRTTQLRTVTGFEATALVDDRGIVRRYTYSIRGRTYGGDPHAETVTVEVVEVGTTTVSPPAGLANGTADPADD